MVSAGFVVEETTGTRVRVGVLLGIHVKVGMGVEVDGSMLRGAGVDVGMSVAVAVCSSNFGVEDGKLSRKFVRVGLYEQGNPS